MGAGTVAPLNPPLFVQVGGGRTQPATDLHELGLGSIAAGHVRELGLGVAVLDDPSLARNFTPSHGDREVVVVVVAVVCLIVLGSQSQSGGLW